MQPPLPELVEAASFRYKDDTSADGQRREEGCYFCITLTLATFAKHLVGLLLQKN